MLNVISPCDGMGPNLFEVMNMRMHGGYNSSVLPRKRNLPYSASCAMSDDVTATGDAVRLVVVVAGSAVASRPPHIPYLRNISLCVAPSVAANPFEASVAMIEYGGNNTIAASIYLSSVGKVVCTVAPSDSDPAQLVIPEDQFHGFYAATNSTTRFVFQALSPSVLVSYRLFCRAEGLTYRPVAVLLFQSSSFYFHRTCHAGERASMRGVERTEGEPGRL